MRRINSLHDIPASTRILVEPAAITVALPFDPDASTVIRTH
jgi:hypothetical protein